MSGNLLNLNIPHPGMPVLNDAGAFTREWYYVVLALLNRTGGNAPITPATLQQQIAALFVEEAMDDVQFPPTPAALPSLMTQALTDDVPRAGINPFLAALLVADAA